VLREDVLLRIPEETEDVAVGARTRLPLLLGLDEDVDDVAFDKVRRFCVSGGRTMAVGCCDWLLCNL